MYSSFWGGPNVCFLLCFLLGDHEAARKHAQSYMPNMKRWGNHTFYAGLSDSRSDEEKAELVEEMWSKYEDMVAEAPEEYGVTFVQAYVRVCKV